MIRLPVLALLLAGLASALAGTNAPSPEKIPGTRDLGDIQKEVATLRGKKFQHEVPVCRISETELRAISDRGLEKDFPGSKLRCYEELLAWLDLVPVGTDLKSASADFLVGQVAGLYDSDTKEMCLPSFPSGTANTAKKTANKKLEQFSLDLENIVLAHEFTHALEDQYWPIDNSKDNDFSVSTDRGTAHSFVLEGSATREMIEAIPAQSWGGSPGRYFLLWNLIHSGLGELALRQALGASWKGPDALVEGVPETLARSEAMPYAFGYAFCTQLMRQWGLDGLDYMYDHPLVSSAQVMHPRKAWEWRDCPVQIDLPETLPGDWKQISLLCVGEADMAGLFGCRFKNLNRGLDVARGWDGDHAALFEKPGGHRLLLWASCWDSTNAASRYLGACVRERQLVHGAVVAPHQGNRITWECPDGRVGSIQRDGKRVVLFETNNRPDLFQAETGASWIAFTEPPEDAARAVANGPLRRFNPLWSWQKDGDYVVTRSLGGLLSRHDRNSVGAADTFLLGVLAEIRRTTSFRKWELGGSLLARHESEARRGFFKTTLLPWGLLFSHCSARLPQAPDQGIRCLNIVWGLGGSVTTKGRDRRSIRALPLGLLLRRTTAPGEFSIHVLGTGYFRKAAARDSSAKVRFRLLGIPIWTTRGRLVKSN